MVATAGVIPAVTTVARTKVPALQGGQVSDALKPLDAPNSIENAVNRSRMHHAPCCREEHYARIVFRAQLYCRVLNIKSG